MATRRYRNMPEAVASTAPSIERAAKEERYRDFWADIGDGFPDLGGAASTDLYLRDEQALFEEFLPDLEGKTVFKTDLWDEARNTRILRWVAAQGASTFGIDISLPIVRRARQQYGIEGLRLGSVVSDVRAIPYRSDGFDALVEIHRVVKPGGRAIIGVPNRWDPFLRPILVALLYFVGKYDYGFEKCYSRREFAQMLQDAGFRVVGESGILFIPGWLRILDLACHAWAPALTAVTAPAVGLFARLSKRFPWLRRHGYLLATVVEKPR